MAINPNRAQARLNKTSEEAVRQLNRIKELPHFIEMAYEAIDAAWAAGVEAEAKLEAIETTYQSVKKSILDGVDVEVNTAQLVELEANINEIKANSAAALQVLDESRTKVKDLAAELAVLQDDPLVVTYAKQAEALARKEASYPQRLKSHLRRCVAHGVADSRLGGKNK